VKTIKSKQDFEKVFSRGKRVNHPLVRVTVLKRGDDEEGRIARVMPKVKPDTNAAEILAIL
jgi:ribonuclease P protein component